MSFAIPDLNCSHNGYGKRKANPIKDEETAEGKAGEKSNKT
jgi:hypothetical protein